jgi:Na+/H+ antiporter NhaC
MDAPKNTVSESPAPSKPNAWALLPFAVFVLFYAGLSVAAGSFDAVPMAVAFAVAGAAAVALDRGRPLARRLESFTRGMGEPNLMLMCLIFAFAGAFASAAKASGAVDAAVAIARAFIPARFMLAGVFVVACLISLAMGTSCGTVAALMPIAAGFAGEPPFTPGVLAGAVVGGAMFGDNLSMISDTTVAAARTLDIGMREKFAANAAIALPAAAVVAVLYSLMAGGDGVAASPAPAAALTARDFLLVSPYLAVFALAVLGVDVLLLLFGGSVLVAAIGVGTGAFGFFDALRHLGDGMAEMSKTMIVALLAFGVMESVRGRGGLAWIVDRMSRAARGSRSCELAIFLLVSLLNVFTANNTLAVLLSGPMAKDCSDRFGIDRARLASLIDTASCIVQGFLPYGGQLLIAVGVGRAAGLALASGDVIVSLYYPPALAVALFVSMFLGKRSPKATAAGLPD